MDVGKSGVRLSGSRSTKRGQARQAAEAQGARSAGEVPGCGLEDTASRHSPSPRALYSIPKQGPAGVP